MERVPMQLQTAVTVSRAQCSVVPNNSQLNRISNHTRKDSSLVPRPSLTAFFAAVEKSHEGRPGYEASRAPSSPKEVARMVAEDM